MLVEFPPVLIVLLLMRFLFALVLRYIPVLLLVPFVVMLLFVMLFSAVWSYMFSTLGKVLRKREKIIASDDGV